MIILFFTITIKIHVRKRNSGRNEDEFRRLEKPLKYKFSRL